MVGRLTATALTQCLDSASDTAAPSHISPAWAREDRHRLPNLALLLQTLTAALPGVVLLSGVRRIH